MELVAAVLTGEPFTVICFLITILLVYSKITQCKRALMRELVDHIDRALIHQKNAFTSELGHVREIGEKESRSLKKLLESKIENLKCHACVKRGGG